MKAKASNVKMLDSALREASTVDEWCIRKWKSSGIKEAVARKLGFRIRTKEQAAGLDLPHFPGPGPGFQIPYFTAAGKRTDFWRFRYALDLMSGFVRQTAKQIKYVQAPGSLSEVYLPPVLDRPWTEVLADTAAKVIVTEGELKSLSACTLLGVPTIGLGGVDSWRANQRGLAMLPSLADTKWQNREVVIVFDNDTATKPNVARAQYQLAKELAGRGALVTIVSLPAEGPKGLDDFLVERGVNAFLPLLDEGTALDEGMALWRLNSEVAFIEDPGVLLVHSRTDDRGEAQARRHPMLISTKQFREANFANRQHRIPGPDGTGSRLVSSADSWLKWGARAQYDRQVYAPGQPFGPCDVDGDRCWNRWRGWAVEPEPGDVSPWKELLDVAFQHESPDKREWFEDWCACQFQRPGVKLHSAAVALGAVTGCGKTLIGDTLAEIFGPYNSGQVEKGELFGSFNEWVMDRQFIVGDEVSSGERRDENDKFKSMLTRASVTVNLKYVRPYTVADCVNYYLTTNHLNAFYLEDSDRRFFIFEFTSMHPDGEAWYRGPYKRWKEGKGPSHLLDYLLKRDIRQFDPHGRAPMTNAKEAVTHASKTPLAQWVGDLRDARLKAGQDIYTPQELAAFAPDDPRRSSAEVASRIGSELFVARFDRVRSDSGSTKSKTREGSKNLWIIRNPDRWRGKSHRECVAHWESFQARKPSKVGRLKS